MKSQVIFLYPGQGSQEVGMGLDLYRSYPRAKVLFGRADRLLGFSLSRLCFEGPDDALNADLNAQLAVFTVSCIVTDLLAKNNVLPSLVSGYSSGFYAAAYAAGCFDFEQGLSLVRQAGEILLEEGKKIDGAMAVVFGLSVRKIAEICSQVGGADVAILNTPRQIIISGIRPSVMLVSKICLREGALDGYLLPVTTAYHSTFMKKSGILLLKEIRNDPFKDPRVPLVSYLSLCHVSDRQDLVKTMAAQLSGPVRWVDVIKNMCHDDTRLFLEVGPGTLLSRAVRWIDRRVEVGATTPKINVLKAIQRCQGLADQTQRTSGDSGDDENGCRQRSSL